MRKNLRLIVTIVLSLMLAITMSHSVFAIENEDSETTTEAVSGTGDQGSGSEQNAGGDEETTETKTTNEYGTAEDALITIQGDKLEDGDAFAAYQVLVRNDAKGGYILNPVLTASDVDIVKVLNDAGANYKEDTLLAAIKAAQDESKTLEEGQKADDVKTTGQSTTEQSNVVNQLAQALLQLKVAGKISATATGSASNGIATIQGGSEGSYIIVGNGSTNGQVYLNMMGSIYENADGKYEASIIQAKASAPTASKEISDTTGNRTSDYGENAGDDDKMIDENTGDTKTDAQSNTIGDTINFTLKASLPSYPSNAKDTTFYMGDTLSAGLSYADTLVVKGSTDNGTKYDVTLTADTADTENDYKVVYYDADGNLVTLTASSTTEDIASVKAFAVVYHYTNLIKAHKAADAADDAVGAPITNIQVTYNTILNESAVIANSGNPNDFQLMYATNPYHNGNYVPGDDDEDGNPNPLYPEANKTENQTDTDYDYRTFVDESIIYTYAIGINKVDAETNAVLSGVKFDVFNADNKLVGQMTTNDKGQAILSGLQTGDYYLVETATNKGYVLLEDVTKVTVTAAKSSTNWTEKTITTGYVTTEIESTYTTTTNTSYTSEQSEAAQQTQATDSNGKELWFESETATDVTTKTGDEANKEKEDKYIPAYVKEVTVTKSKGTPTVKNENKVLTTTVVVAGEGDTDLTSIPMASVTTISNTKLGSLPATGGMGTYIFTIVGVCIMVCAAGLYFVNRKRRNA
jgi:LPXTG-motif cell wall-anchored protein